MTACDWDALRQLRWSGRKPALPVIVTMNPVLPARFDGVGCMTILHKRGEAFPAALLRGLEVIAFFDSCSEASKVQRIFDRLDCYPARFQVWCICGSCLTVCPRSCADQAAIDDWLSTPGELPKLEGAA